MPPLATQRMPHGEARLTLQLLATWHSGDFGAAAAAAACFAIAAAYLATVSSAAIMLVSPRRSYTRLSSLALRETVVRMHVSML